MGLLHPSETDLIDYIDGEMSPRRTLAVKEHVGRCRGCALSLARVREAASAAAAVSYVPVPQGLRHRVAAAVRAKAPQITCREAAPLLHEALDRRLAPLASLPLQHHLDSCPKCRTELAALAAAARLVRELPQVEAPAGVRQRVAVAVRGRSRRAPVVLQWRPALATASVVLVIGILALVRPAPKPESTVIARGPAVTASPQPAPVEIASTQPEVAAPERAASPVVSPPLESAEEPASAADLTVRPSTSTRPSMVVRAVRLEPKGPAPAQTTPEGSSPKTAMPGAFTALRVVAKSASYETEVHRAMEMAGDRFATLRSETVSEATLASLPGPPLEGLTDNVHSDMSPVGHGATEDVGSPRPSSSSAPRREGASLLWGPFV